MIYRLTPSLPLLSEDHWLKNWPKSLTSYTKIPANNCHVIKYVSMKLNYVKFMFEITSPWSSRNQKSGTAVPPIMPFHSTSLHCDADKDKKWFLAGATVCVVFANWF